MTTIIKKTRVPRTEEQKKITAEKRVVNKNKKIEEQKKQIEDQKKQIERVRFYNFKKNLYSTSQYYEREIEGHFTYLLLPMGFSRYNKIREDSTLYSIINCISIYVNNEIQFNQVIDEAITIYNNEIVTYTENEMMALFLHSIKKNYNPNIEKKLYRIDCLIPYKQMMQQKISTSTSFPLDCIKNIIDYI
jgi:predicted RNase H-like nuclease (RuvC/YqgF family)